MAQNHIEQNEAPMTRGGTIQGPSRRYRRLRHPTFPADEWTDKNPLLQRGELGIESDTHQIKAGDGYTLWNDLPYASGAVTSVNSQTGDVTITAASLGALTNNATGTYSIAVGQGSEATSGAGVAYGRLAKANGGTYDRGIAIGQAAVVTASAIQLNVSNVTQTNSDANTFKVANDNGNYEIMSADGTIPEARLADTTGATQGDVLTLDSTGNAVWQAGGSNYVQKTGDTMTGDLRFTKGDMFSTSSRVVFDEVDPVYNRVTIAKRTSLDEHTGDQLLHFYGGKSATIYADFYMDFVQYNFFCRRADATLGSQYYPWAKAYVAEINNGADITVPATGGTMVVATPPAAAGTYVLKAVVDGDGNITTQWVAE